MNTIDKYFEYLKKMDLIADLIYFQGPILSLLSDEKGNLYIYKWCGIDEQKNGHLWLIFHVSFQTLLDYANKKISECALVENAIPNSFLDSYYLLVSISSELTYSLVDTYVSKKEVPDIYMPHEDVFFDEDYCDDKMALKEFITINEAKQIGIIEKNILLYRDVYSVMKNKSYKLVYPPNVNSSLWGEFLVNFVVKNPQNIKENFIKKNRIENDFFIKKTSY